MGLLGLKRLMSMQRERKGRRQIQAPNGLITSVPQKNDSLCQDDDHFQGGKRSRYSGPNLPEDIWCHIRSLVPLQDAARSACVSRTFLRSWRCHPKLILSKKTLGLKRKACVKGDRARCFTSRVDHILKNHSGTGVKFLKLEIPDYCNVTTCHLNNWLQIAITPGIEEVSLFYPSNDKEEYNFPCSLLFDGRGNSIRYLYLNDCAFRPPVGFDCLKSLTKLHLYEVRITGDELGCLISKSFALKQLQLTCCSELNCLKIPFWLERLSWLSVFGCNTLQVIESNAPNLSTFRFFGDPVHLSLRESSQVKILKIGFSDKPNSVSYAITKLPSTVPNLEILTITSVSERVNSPMVADKFLSLKYLKICLGAYCQAFSPAYDYLSLVSFLDASPVLETFILGDDMKHDSVFGDASHMRQSSGHKHDRLKKVQINGFCSAKSMVELTCHILENATSLESLTLDTVLHWEVNGEIRRCSVQKTGECRHLCRDMILEAHKALRAVERYILGRVPSTVKLNVGEPCSRCHAIDVKLS
ncbi:uncharacterized protein LOC133925124 isoform X2 [Phragmites australis]|uniref:uncharacterized protein LOC133925124 isoform X2 n=1 Tax=Phragmites australis TaxID=29695 RepID=UPI002D7710F0|nr:uncharacterized protein LOC133925124 isoform X2 [Phragmites australis]